MPFPFGETLDIHLKTKGNNAAKNIVFAKYQLTAL